MRLWKLSNNVNAALRKQILTVIDNIYLRALKNAHTGYSNLRTRDILQYLFDHYGRITPQALLANDERFRQDWDPTSPFELLIDQIESAQEFARDGNQPYSGRQILTNAFNLVYKTGMFFDDCKKWQEKPPNEQTWDNFKAHFLQAQDQLRLQQTAKQTGYFGSILDKHLSAQCIKIDEATNNFLAATQQHEQDLSTILAS